MLMTVLKGPLAVKQSKALIRTFKKMKDYILDNRNLIGQRELLQLSMETANNRIEISKIHLCYCRLIDEFTFSITKIGEWK